MTTGAEELLQQWLARQLEPAQMAWLERQLAAMADGPPLTDLHIALGMVPRRLGKADLRIGEDDLAAANAARSGFDPTGWTVADAARVALLVALRPPADKGFAGVFADLCATADVSEAITLYRGLPLYRAPQTLLDQVGEGLRTNIRAVFEAIAHRNPFPRDHFDDHRWNHMVLKALFVGSRLAPIQGLDARANEELARIMRDFAHERWAAGRVVPFEIWRCVGPFARGDALADLQRALGDEDTTQRSAAALALSASQDPQAARILSGAPDLAADIAAGRLSWKSLD